MPHLLIQSDGSVALMRLYNQTLEDAVRDFQQVNPGIDIVDIKDVADDQVPANRAFRDAWRHCEKIGIRHCMDTAKAIHKDRLRAARKSRFAETDAALIQAVTGGRDASRIKDMAQRLRDVTKDEGIALAKTPEDLAAVWPAVLDEAVPPAGDVLPDGTPIDTSGLDAWAASLNSRLAALEQPAEPQATMTDMQKVLMELDSMNDRLNRAERMAAFAIKEGVGPGKLTQEELT